MPEKTVKPLVPRIVMVAGAVLLVACFFLPYLAGTAEFREQALAAGDVTLISSVGVTAAQMADLSLFELANVLNALVGLSTGAEADVVSAVVTVFFYGLLALSVLTLVLAALGRPLGALVPCVLSAMLVTFVRTQFLAPAVADNQIYGWGVASWLCYVAAAVVVAGAVWMLVARRGAEGAVPTPRQA